MAKFKRRKMQKVYHNRYRTTWSPDEKEEAMIPGTVAYNQRQADKLLDSFDKTKNEEELIEDIAKELGDKIDDDKKPVDENDIPAEELKHEVHDVGKRKYRRYMSKEVQVKEVRNIAQEAMIKFPGEQSYEEELHDDGVSGEEFKKEVLRDYSKDIDALIKQDNNHDGEVDEEDITPGMRRIMKYM